MYIESPAAEHLIYRTKLNFRQICLSIYKDARQYVLFCISSKTAGVQFSFNRSKRHVSFSSPLFKIFMFQETGNLGIKCVFHVHV